MRFFTHTIVPIVHICNDNAKSNAKGIQIGTFVIEKATSKPIIQLKP